MYIVIEGQDGTGKDTQADLLAEYFKKQNRKVVRYSESGTNSLNPFIREVAKLNFGSKQDISNRTRVLLYLVNRYEQWHKIAEPALRNGDIVIVTRNWFSTLIYEGYMGGVSRSTIIKLHKQVMPDYYFRPDKIFFLTLTEQERAARREAQGERTVKEFWKSKPSDFQQKLNESYMKVANDFHIPTISASGTPGEVFQRIINLINPSC